MGSNIEIADEPTTLDQGSRSFHGKEFEDEALSSINFMEAQQGPVISLQYSIENGVEETNPRKNNISFEWLSFVNANPRRRKISTGICIGIFLIVFISTIASATSNSHSDTIEDNESRFNAGGRAQGFGGASNSIFFQSQNENVFFGDDVLIPPFSLQDPVEDLGRYGYDRPERSSPSARLDPLVNRYKKALPTNAWYQNMLRLGISDEPTKDHRVYTVPYMIDAAGEFAGVRAHATRLEATTTQVRVAIDEPYALTLGAMPNVDVSIANRLDKGYSVHDVNDLGITLQWDSYMKTTLVRGSPYVTMTYNMMDPSVTEGNLPTMHWGLDTSESPIADGSRTIDCESKPVFTVERDIELAFLNSGQRWLIFFSQPVRLQCRDTRGSPTILQVLKDDDYSDDPKLVIRGALIVSSSSSADDSEVFSKTYANKLRESAGVYPGQNTAVVHSFSDDNDRARLSFDWDAQSMHSASGMNQMISRSSSEMITFALPHHQDVLVGNVYPTLCTSSLLGPVCLVKGNVWNMYEKLPAVDFQAARHPDPKYLPVLAQALVEDIRYQIPPNFQSGAADTYFSGKTVAKLGRILLITEEVMGLCAVASAGGSNSRYADACEDLELPSDGEIEDALNQLRDAVTTWVKTNTEAPFVYDNSWGGLVSCGCLYDGGKCTNEFPNCPAFTDQGLNFGNGFYNDHHFHYGYHVYAAAVLAHFDAKWAIDHYEDVTLLVRDYANPSTEDESFPVFRNKDWYRGHSWASGLTDPMFGNIMNQESTSEAVMAYEAVALFGRTMATIFEDAGDNNKASVAKMMHRIGLTLTATEIRSTQKYWQIQQNVDESKKTFPEPYTASVVGILWETFAEFTTWFGNAPYLIYGIQLLPLTPISEARDNREWAEEIYEPLAASCNGACVAEGWSIQVNAILATIGRVQEAIEGISQIPSNAYQHAGGNGHSKSNALWYISTRPTGNNNPSFITPSPIDTTPTDVRPSFNSEEESEVTSAKDDLALDILEEEIFEAFDEEDEEEAIGSSGSGAFGMLVGENDDGNNIFGDDVTRAKDDLALDILEEEIFEAFDEEDEEEAIGSSGSGVFDMIAGENDDGNNIFDDDGLGNDSPAGITCFNPTICTNEILDRDAGGHSCHDRIVYLMDVLGKSEFDACQQVAVNEYSIECGFCRPDKP